MRPLDLVYGLGLLLLGAPLLLLRKLRGKRTVPLRDRLGHVPGPIAATPRIWVHGVSVGEVLAAKGLVGGLAARHPQDEIVVTTTTATGLDVARRSYPEHRVLPAPVDLSFAVRRFLVRLRPRLLVLMELELWPHLLAECARAGVPVVVANAKISERSARGYRRLGPLGRRMLGRVQAFLAQEASFAERFRALGVAPERVVVAGNLKVGNLRFEDPSPRRARLREEHGFSPEARLLVAGSTHPGEEAAWLAVLERLRGRIPDLRLILVPRHPERLKEVETSCRSRSERVGFRTRPLDPPDPEVLIVDTMGELGDLYAVADLAFVGGTLAPIGGHNPLEPARFGLPTLVGPHVHTVRETVRWLEEAEVLHRVTEDVLPERVEALLDDARAAARARTGARRVLAAHADSLERTLRALDEVLAGRSLTEESSFHG